MANSDKQKLAEAAWDRIESLGGHGVWERELVVVSFSNSSVTDDDLALFRDFPFVQILDLSHTKISDKGLAILPELPAREEVNLTDSKVSETGIKAFQHTHPAVKITTKSPAKGTMNPFTGKPL